MLQTIEIEVGSTPVSYSVIWLHGLGADGHDFEPIVPHLGLDAQVGVRFIFPHAPEQAVTINNGNWMRAWYDIKGMEINDKQDEPGTQRSAQLITELIVHENQRGIGTDRIVLAGFSQGGAIALYLGLRYHQSFAGIMALSSYLPIADKTATQMSTANLKTPLFIGHGKQDPVVPCQYGLNSYDTVKQLGFDPIWHEYTMQHAVSPEEISDIGNWLKGLFR